MQPLASITFGQGLLTVLEIALLATWVWVTLSVILDVYRSPDLTRAAKAGWIFVIVLIPLLGVMIYVIARGDKLSRHEIGGERQLEALRDRGVLTDEEFQRASHRRAHRTDASRADDVAALEDLRDHGVLTGEEFQPAKVKPPRSGASSTHTRRTSPRPPAFRRTSDREGTHDERHTELARLERLR